MRIWAISAAILMVTVDLGWSQVDIPSAQKSGLPMYRPILLGTGANSLVNRIDTAALMKQGQKDAAVMFSCSVKKDGSILDVSTYRGTPDSKLLGEELIKRLSAAANPKMIPAVYNHMTVDAVYYGTVLFSIVDGKPRLRIFSNQEREELAKEADFISPQPFWGGDSKFEGFHYPDPQAAPVGVDAMVELELRVDAAGNLQQGKVVDEKPPFLGFGETAFADMKRAKFIPAFRNGKPVAANVKVPVYYKAPGF